MNVTPFQLVVNHASKTVASGRRPQTPSGQPSRSDRFHAARPILFGHETTAAPDSLQSLVSQGVWILSSSASHTHPVVQTLQQNQLNPIPLIKMPTTLDKAPGMIWIDDPARLKPLDELTPATTILAIAPGAQRIGEITTGLKAPERVIGVRFLPPADKNKVVELTAGPATSPETLEKTRRLLRAMGKVTVLATQDLPGGLAEQLRLPVQMEAIRLVEQGWGSAKEVDSVIQRLLNPKAEGGKSARRGILPTTSELTGKPAQTLETLKSILGTSLPETLTREQARIQEVYRTAPTDPSEKPISRLFPKGVPSSETAQSQLPLPDREKQIESRLAATLFKTAKALVQQGAVHPEGLETIARMGLSWKIGPFSAMNALNPTNKTWPLTGVTSQTRDGICTITMDRPFEVNTLKIEVLEAIVQKLKQAEQDPTVRAIVLESNAGKVFSGGADLSMFKDSPSVEIFKWGVDTGKELINRIAQSPKLTIAKVQGPTYGASTELALAFDRLVVSDDFSMKLPEVNIGLAPVWGGTERMVRKIGRPLAKALILNGKFEHGLVPHLPWPLRKLVNGPLNLDIDQNPGFKLDAPTAQRLGLVDKVVPRQLLDDAVAELLRQPETYTKPDPNRGFTQYQTISDYPEAIQQAYQLATIEQETAQHLGRFSKRARPLAEKLLAHVGTPQEGALTDADYQQMAEDTKAKIQKIYDLKDMALALKAKHPRTFLAQLWTVINNSKNT
jgi:enoyl-CoA hydratase/carnithine racemase